MKYEDNNRSANGGVQQVRAGASEVMLRAEIGFWRELLNNCGPGVPLESIERMKQALALAELRFLQLCRGVHADRASCAGPARASTATPTSIH